MITSNKKNKRFSLLFLEEGEIYTRDCMGYRYHTDSFPEKRQEKGRIHICSRALFFEPEDTDTPTVRYSFRDMQGAPSEVLAPRIHYNNSDNTSRLVFVIEKMTILPEPSRPAPYQLVKFDVPQTVYFDFTYESVTSMTQWISELYNKNSSHSAGFDQDSELADFVNQRERTIRFDMSRVESMSERPLLRMEMLVKRILPFMQMPGLLHITDKRVYFQPIYRVSAKPVKSVQHSDIVKLHKRRWKLRNLGFELYTQSGKSLFLAFYSERDRDQIYTQLLSLVPRECETEGSVENMTLKWQLRQISNFDYIMYLNSAAYRTFSDFTQYPVFPWIIADYASSDLDLSNPAVFRDLTKPIGALNQNRLDALKRRYRDMPHPKFLYGTHYSTPGYIMGFLIRSQPLFMLKLHVSFKQAGKFDSADRLFHEIAAEWRNVLENPADVKELIPEFYYEDPSFLINRLSLNMGVRHNGEKVWDVKLPPWASSAQDFLLKMRQALESEYVSENLHNWIDLIFGYKQTGEHAIQADNGEFQVVFHPMTYEGSIDIDSINDPVERRAIEIQINEFGQTPKQLFKIPHPQRSAIAQQERRISLELESSSSLTWDIGEIGRKQNAEVTEITLHKKKISSIHLLETRIVTTGYDGCVKVVTLDRFQKRSFPVCDLALTCGVLVNDKTIVSGSYDNKLYVFSLGTARVMDAIPAHDDAVSCCEYYPDFNLVVSGSWDNLVKLWDFRNNKLAPALVLDEHDEQITSICRDPTGRQPNILLTADMNGKIMAHDIRATDHRVLWEFGTDERIWCMKQSLRSEHLICAMDSRVSMFEAQGIEVSSVGISGVQTLVTDGSFALAGKEDAPLELFDLMKGDIACRWDGICNISAVACEGKANCFYAGSAEGMLYLIKQAQAISYQAFLDFLVFFAFLPPAPP